MAEEFVRLVKIGIDKSFIQESIANADRLTKSIDELKKVKKEEGQLSAEQEGRLKALTAERNKNIQVVKQANLLTSEQIKGQEQLKAQLSILTAQYNKLTTEEQKNTKEGQALQKQILGITEELKSNEKAVGDNRRNVGNYGDAVKGVAGQINVMGVNIGSMIQQLQAQQTAMKAAVVATNGTSKALNILKLAIIGTGIGAFLVVLTSLTAAFQSSEEGQNRWNKILTVTGALVGNVMDLFADLGEMIIDVFKNPQQALKDFANLIKENIQNRFEGLVELIPQLGKSINLLFKGEFAEAGKVALDATAKVSIGVENLTDKLDAGVKKTKEFIAEQEREARLAAKVADMRAKADIVERNLTIERAKLESQVAELRLKARKEDEFSAAERKKFLQEAQTLQDEILNKETEYLTLRKDAQVLENTFSRTNKENKDKEAEAIAALSQIEAKRFTEQRQLQREFNTINKQIDASNKKRTDEEKKAAEKAIKDLEQGYQKERELIEQQAELEKAQATISIANAEERAARIAFIEKEALLAKLRSIEDETVAYTASADAIGAVDEEKYAKQLAERAKYEAQLAEMDRAAKAEAFTRQVELLNGQEQLDIEAAELSIKNENDLQTRKYQIALDYAQQRLALMREEALLDDVLTEKEIQNLQSVENEIKRIQEQLANPDAPTAAQSLGLSEQQISDMQLGLDAISQALQAVQQATQAAAQNRIAEIDQQSKAEIDAINKSTLSTEQKEKKITEAEQKAAKERYKVELAQFKTAKALQIALAVANTATAVMAQLSNPTPYAGFVLAALAAATGAVQIGIVASQKPPPPPAFATGGYVRGAGSGTSDSITARLSNGESVNNAKTTAMFAPILSAMNKAGGGVDWYRGEGYAKGGIVQKFAAGGVVSSSSAIMRENEATREIQQTIINTPNVLVIEEFQNVQGRQVRTEQNLQV